MSIESMIRERADRIAELTEQANSTTGKGDATLSAAVQSLIDGYGGTGVGAITYNGENEYVAAYLAASEAYIAGSRTTSIAPAYAGAVEGVRKDFPGAGAMGVSGGELMLRDRTGGTVALSVDDGTAEVHSISPIGGDAVNLPASGTAKAALLVPTGTVRMIKAPSVANVRDVGGWPCDGGTVRYGLLYRSGELTGITEADREIMTDLLSIRTEVDYTAAEPQSSLGSKVDYYNYATNKLYTQLLNLDGADHLALAGALKKLMESAIAGRPAVFHCSYGADRTGVTAWLLLALLGVGDNDLDRDYELTSFSSAGFRLRKSTDYTGMIDYLKTCSTSASPRECAVAWCVLAGIDIDLINSYRASMINGDAEDIEAEIDYRVKSVALSTESIEVTVGNAVTVTATVSPSWATGSVSWSASPTGKITIAPNGRVATISGTAAGTVTLTASADGASASAVVTVTQDTPSYTNLVPTSITPQGEIYEGVGYKDGIRISSSGSESAQAGATTTGFIPCVLGDTIRIAGALWNKADTSISCAFMGYDASFNLLGTQDGRIVNAYGAFAKNGSVYVYKIGDAAQVISGSGAYSKITSSNVRYIRITAAGAGASLIVTKNEEI